MTDWAQLSHAYGSARELPRLLERVASKPSEELWTELWSALYHQGDVFPASFAALPWLAGVAESENRQQVEHALLMAGSILAGQGHRPRDVRTAYAGEIAIFLRATNQLLRVCGDSTSYVYLLGSMLSFEDSLSWSDDLAAGLGNGEVEVICPACDTQLYVALGDPGYFSTTSDFYWRDATVSKSALLPAADLTGIGRRLHDIALGDGKKEVATALTYLFGSASCSDCGEVFAVAEHRA